MTTTQDPIRHTAYLMTTTGKRRRHPFASFPHAEAARRWMDAHPGERVIFSPPLPDTDHCTCPINGWCDVHQARGAGQNDPAAPGYDVVYGQPVTDR